MSKEITLTIVMDAPNDSDTNEYIDIASAIEKLLKNYEGYENVTVYNGDGTAL